MTKNQYFTVPNFLTFLRLALTPLVIWLLFDERLRLAALIFLCAGITDWFDGYLARIFKSETNLGRLFDPIADKVLLVGTYTALGILGVLPLWITGIIIARDIMIIGGSFLVWYHQLSIQLEPLVISKINTFFQIILVLLVLCRGFLEQSETLSSLIQIIIYVTLTTTIVSGFTYAKTYFQHRKKHPY